MDQSPDRWSTELSPEERLPRLNVYHRFWRNGHDGNRAGALDV